ncbi:hypothetical protein WA158_001209 [Blastocystis sp. Blastoise]
MNILYIILFLEYVSGYINDFEINIRSNSKSSLSSYVALNPGSLIQGSIEVIPDPEYDNHEACIAIYDSDQYPREWQYSDDVDSYLCLHRASYRIRFRDSISFRYQVQRTHQYTVVALNCDENYLLIKGNISMVILDNNNYRHIALNDLPDLFIWPLATITYCILTVIMFFMYCSREFRGTQSIHAADYIIVLLSCIETIRCIELSVYTYFSYQNDFTSFNIIVLFMLLLASGWQITHMQFTSNDRRILVIFGGLLVIIIIERIGCGYSMNGLCNTFNILVIIIYGFMFLYVFIMANITLSKIIKSLSSPVYNDKTIMLYINRAMIYKFMKITSIYILSPLISYVITEFILSWKYQFIKKIINEIITIYTLFSLRHMLHPRTYSGYFRINKEILHNQEELVSTPVEMSSFSSDTSPSMTRSRFSDHVSPTPNEAESEDIWWSL